MDLILGSVIFGVALLTLIVGLYMMSRDLFQTRKVNRNKRLQSKKEKGRLKLLEAPPELSLPGRLIQKFDDLAIDAGVEMSPTHLRLWLLLLATTLAGVMLLWRDSPGGALLAFFLAYFVSWGILMIRRVARRRIVEEQLPEAIHLMARAVRAGESTDQAIELVARETQPPLQQEFQRCSHQLQMGLSMPDAMRHLARRTKLGDLRLFATTLMVHRHTGGNLPVTLERMGDVMRARLDYRRQFRSATAGGRLSMITICTLALGLLVYMAVYKTDYLERLTEGSLGWTMLATAATMQLMGIVWLAGLMRTDY